MLGWHISVYRQESGGDSPASFGDPQGVRLAVWQTGLGGIDWITDLVEAGNAIDLGGNGYPYQWTAKAVHLTPQLLDGPPDANAVWISSPDDVLTSEWNGKTTQDLPELAKCDPDEWLIIEVWDES